MAIGSLAVDPANTNTVYAGTGEANVGLDLSFGGGMFKSTNAGSRRSHKVGGTVFDACHRRRPPKRERDDPRVRHSRRPVDALVRGRRLPLDERRRELDANTDRRLRHWTALRSSRTSSRRSRRRAPSTLRPAWPEVGLRPSTATTPRTPAGTSSGRPTTGSPGAGSATFCRRPGTAGQRSRPPRRTAIAYMPSPRARSADYGNLQASTPPRTEARRGRRLPKPTPEIEVSSSASAVSVRASSDSGSPSTRPMPPSSSSERSPRTGRPTPGRRGRRPTLVTATTPRSPSKASGGRGSPTTAACSKHNRRVGRKPERDAADHGVRWGHGG